MRSKSTLLKLLGIMMVLALGFSALSMVAAQEATPEASQEISPRVVLGVTVIEDDHGGRITAILPGSPAEAAGLQVDDVITHINGEEVDATLLAEMIRSMAVGDEVTLTISRDGESQDLTATLAAAADLVPAVPSLQFNTKNGVGLSFDGTNWTVTKLSEDTALYEAGLREGDLITAVNGEAFGRDMLRPLFQNRGDAENVTLTVQRGDETLDVEIPVSLLQTFMGTVQISPDMGIPFGDGGMMPFGQGNVIPFGGMMNMMGGGGRLGVTFVTLDEQTATENNVELTEGALITEVIADSPAAVAGLQAGDVVTAVDGDVVDAERTLRDRLYAYEPDDTVTLDVTRGGETMQLEVTLGQPTMGSEFMPFGGNGFFFGQGRGDRFGRRGFGFPFGGGEVPAEPTPEVTPNA